MKAIIILVNGFEEVEALTVVDVFRRAGIDITIAGLVSTVIQGAHDIKVIAERRLSDINTKNYGILILPGGEGYKSLMNSQTVLNLIRNFNSAGKYIAAICAAPAVLAKAGVLDDRIATIYPGMEKMIPKPREGKIIIDKNIITARGPGVAMLFALKLVEIIKGKKNVNRLKNDIVVE